MAGLSGFASHRGKLQDISGTQPPHSNAVVNLVLKFKFCLIFISFVSDNNIIEMRQTKY